MRRSLVLLMASSFVAAPAGAQPADRARAGADAPLPPSDSGGKSTAAAAATAAPAPAPVPAPAPAPAAAAPATSMDLEKLRADFERLREELFRARARAQVVAEATYPSRLSATLRWKGGANQLVRHAQIRLDGAEVWDSGGKPVSDELISVAERAVKPGPHALTVRLEVRPGKKTKDAETLGYVSEHTFAVIARDKVKTRVAITADEDGDPPEYEPNLDVEIETEK
ncbi:MAG TPA: hypothetical protein VMU50_22455 [Polyangia bacterium]|nr:hypothetical protein [Polyangia bacterium]